MRLYDGKSRSKDENAYYAYWLYLSTTFHSARCDKYYLHLLIHLTRQSNCLLTIFFVLNFPYLIMITLLIIIVTINKEAFENCKRSPIDLFAVYCIRLSISFVRFFLYASFVINCVVCH